MKRSYGSFMKIQYLIGAFIGMVGIFLMTTGKPNWGIWLFGLGALIASIPS